MPSIIDHIDQFLIDRYLGKLVYSRDKRRSFVVRQIDTVLPDGEYGPSNGMVSLMGDLKKRVPCRSFTFYEGMPEAFPSPVTDSPIAQ